MGFLLAKILLLGVVAAFLGALFTRWYLRRNMRDVTNEYTQMKADEQAWRKSLERLIAQRPQPDFAPLQKHFVQIESAIRAIPAPIATDLSPVMQVIAAIPTPLTVDLTPVMQAIAAIPTPTATDLAPVIQKIAAIPTPAVADLSPVMQAIAAIPAPPAVELRPVVDQLGNLERLIKSIVIPVPQAVDLGAVQSRLDTLERSVNSISIPVPKEVDLSNVLERLSALEQAVHGIVIPAATHVDLQPILQRLSELDAHIQKAQTADPDEPRLVPVSIMVNKAVSESPSVRAGSRNLLSHAGFGAADDLQRMKGVKGVMEKMLHDIGVYYFWQIAEWTATDIVHADAQLTAFHGRIQRDGWVGQASELARAPDASVKPASVGDGPVVSPVSQTTEAERAST